MQKSQQEFMQFNIPLFSEKRQPGILSRAGAFIKINTVYYYA